MDRLEACIFIFVHHRERPCLETAPIAAFAGVDAHRRTGLAAPASREGLDGQARLFCFALQRRRSRRRKIAGRRAIARPGRLWADRPLKKAVGAGLADKRGHSRW